MTEIRARVVVVTGESETGIGVECYRPNPPEPSEVYYIASLYVDRSVRYSEGLRIAVDHLRETFGNDCALIVKTPHVGAAYQAQRKVKNAKIHAENRRKRTYIDTTALAEDSIKKSRRFNIDEFLIPFEKEKGAVKNG
jgi:hypothetical protein